MSPRPRVRIRRPREWQICSQLICRAVSISKCALRQDFRTIFARRTLQTVLFKKQTSPAGRVSRARAPFAPASGSCLTDGLSPARRRLLAAPGSLLISAGRVGQMALSAARKLIAFTNDPHVCFHLPLRVHLVIAYTLSLTVRNSCALVVLCAPFCA